MRVLVIGGTNFIGPPVIHRLAGAGHEVTVFHRGRTEARLPESVTRLKGDRHDLSDYAEDFKRLAPDVVLDMIPMNEREARDVLEVFGGISRRLVAISSQDVYRAYDIVRGRHTGPPDPVPLSEDAPLRERLYPYEREDVEDYEKILVEKVVMGEVRLPGTVLRLPMVYGPGDYMHRLYPYLRRMEDGRPAILLEKGMSSWRWTMGYVEDVAAAIALAATDERAAGRVYNVGERESRSWAEWVRDIGHAAGWSGGILEGPLESVAEDLRLGANHDQHLVTDTSRIRRELGYTETVTPEEALRRTVAWERNHLPDGVNPEDFDYAAEDAALNSL